MKNTALKCQDKAKLLSYGMGFVYFLSLVPILYVSFFSHPVSDDYSYSIAVHNAIIKNGNVLEVLSAAWSKARDTYFSWQGTFSAVFIFSFQPGIYSQDLYFLTSFIMIGALSTTTVFLIRTILVKWLNTQYAGFISFFLLLMSVQFIPDKAQAYYWFNGSSYYTLFYSFALFLSALIIRLLLSNSIKHVITLFIVSLVLAIIIGGGNYTTALICIELLAITTILLMLKKSTKCKYVFMVFAVMLVSFVISVIAPGNAVRASSISGMLPIKAVLKSVYYAIAFIANWTKLPQIVFFVLITPVIFHVTKKCTWSFRLPLAIILIAFLCFASQLTPPLFAMSHYGDGRQINIYYYSYYIFLMFIDFYVCGWINKKYPDIIKIRAISSMFRDHCVPIVLLSIVVWSAGCYEFGIRNMTSVATTIASLEGTVQKYDVEYDEMVRELGTENGVCKIEGIATTPDFFWDLGVSEDSRFWVNTAMAKYFGVDSISLNVGN